MVRIEGGSGILAADIPNLEVTVQQQHISDLIDEDMYDDEGFMPEITSSKSAALLQTIQLTDLSNRASLLVPADQLESPYFTFLLSCDGFELGLQEGKLRQVGHGILKGLFEICGILGLSEAQINSHRAAGTVIEPPLCRAVQNVAYRMTLDDTNDVKMFYDMLLHDNETKAVIGCVLDDPVHIGDQERSVESYVALSVLGMIKANVSRGMVYKLPFIVITTKALLLQYYLVSVVADDPLSVIADIKEYRGINVEVQSLMVEEVPNPKLAYESYDGFITELRRIMVLKHWLLKNDFRNVTRIN